MWLRYVPACHRSWCSCPWANSNASLCAQLAEAIPVPGSGASLPLDLHRIAARCRNSYYAPKKFSAVQLAYSEPRCRVLIFHTGRLVGTGMLTRDCTLPCTFPFCMLHLESHHSKTMARNHLQCQCKHCR